MTTVTWVLILYVSYHSGFTSHEFTSEKNCQIALAEAKKMTSYSVYGTCVEK